MYCVSNGPQRREYFRKVSSVRFTKSLIFVFLALGRKISHNTKQQSERSNFTTLHDENVLRIFL